MSTREVVVEFIGRDRGLNSTISSADSRSSKLGSTLAKVGKVAAVGLAAGAVVAGKALFDMTKGAMEDEAAQRALALTLKNTAGATDKQVAGVEDWISKQGKLLGVTDDELRPALQRMAEATGDVGKAQKLTSLAMDVSAGTGRSLKSVTEALLRAQNGSVSGLSRYGIATQKANGETKSFHEVVKGMSETFGGQASEKANTLQGKMDRLRLIFDETKESIGAKLLPVVTELATWFLDKGVPAISSFGDYLSNNLGPAFSRIGDVIGSVFGGGNGGAAGQVSSALTDVQDIVKSTVSIVLSLWHRFGGILTRYTQTSLKNAIQIISGAFKVIAGIFKLVAALLKGDWSGAWDAVKQIVKGAVQLIVGILKQFNNIVSTLGRLLWSAFKAIAKAGWDATVSVVRAGADKVVEYVKSIPDRLRAIAGMWRSAGAWLIDSFVDGMKNAAGIVSGIAGNVWSAVKGLLNSAIGKLRSALNFTISLPGPDLHVSVGDQIPYLAKGTRNFIGGLAVVGERGPELVRLPGGADVYSNRDSRGMVASAVAAATGGDQRIVIELDGRVLWQGLLRQRRLIGKGLGLD